MAIIMVFRFMSVIMAVVTTIMIVPSFRIASCEQQTDCA